MNQKTKKGQQNHIVIESLVFQLEHTGYQDQESKLECYAKKLAELEFFQGEQVDPGPHTSPVNSGR